MNTNRPKINVPFEPIDIILDFISVTLLVLLISFTFIEYSSLPEIIPTHFDANGNADGFDNKSMLWLLPAIGLVMFVGLFILNKYPHLHNYMINITKENALKNYRFSTRIVRIVNFLCIVLFAYIQYIMISASKGETAALGSWFLPVVIGLSILLPIGILIYYRTLNKT